MGHKRGLGALAELQVANGVLPRLGACNSKSRAQCEEDCSSSPMQCREAAPSPLPVPAQPPCCPLPTSRHGRVVRCCPAVHSQTKRIRLPRHGNTMGAFLTPQLM